MPTSGNMQVLSAVHSIIINHGYRQTLQLLLLSAQEEEEEEEEEKGKLDSRRWTQFKGRRNERTSANCGA
ncbi:hypothetical protein SLA2020_398270 [Shorea laevis]